MEHGFLYAAVTIIVGLVLAGIAQLILWTNNYDFAWEVQDWVNSRILRRFAEEKIEIPFRQVDVRVRNRGPADV
ncbi:MAG: hypothetical protein WCX22_09510 [Methanoregula sp.]